MNDTGALLLENSEGHKAMAAAVRRDPAQLPSLLTAVLALLAALTGVLLSRGNTRCLLAKNEAILAQGRAADTWAFYQSRNIRSEILALNRELSPSAALDARIRKLNGEKAEAFAQAKQAEAERDRLQAKSAAALKPLGTLVISLVLFQIALALSPAYLVLRRPVLLCAAAAVGGGGLLALIAGAAACFGLF